MSTFKNFVIHWKTSLFGIAAASMNLLAHGQNWKSVAMSTALALLGLFSKDSNK